MRNFLFVVFFTETCCFFFVYLSGVIESNGTLQSLSLDGVALSEAACRSIGDAMASNFSLTSLNLAGAGMRDGGCDYILSGLMGNTTLQTLNLQMNSKLPRFPFVDKYFITRCH